MKISNQDVYDRLMKASEALGNTEGETTAGDSALKTARLTLLQLQMAMLAIIEGVRLPQSPPD